MRKVLLTVVSAALMGASTLSGAVVPHAFAQDNTTALEGQVLAACAVDEAEFRSLLAEYSAQMAELVASGAITSDEALARFQALRDAAREADCGPVVDEAFEELFPDTAATGAVAPAAIAAGGESLSATTGGDAEPDLASPN
jgi:hypothetical protein